MKGKIITLIISFILLSVIFSGLNAVAGESLFVYGFCSSDGAKVTAWVPVRSNQILTDEVGPNGNYAAPGGFAYDTGNYFDPWTTSEITRTMICEIIDGKGYSVQCDDVMNTGAGVLFLGTQELVMMSIPTAYNHVGWYEVNWTASPDPACVGYLVYRSNPGGGSGYNLVGGTTSIIGGYWWHNIVNNLERATSWINDTSFEDHSIVPGNYYQYAIRYVYGGEVDGVPIGVPTQMHDANLGQPAQYWPVYSGYSDLFPPLPQLDIPVVSGWNLISYPLWDGCEPPMPDVIFDDAGGDTTWSVLKWYNPQTPEDLWKTYRFGSSTNDLNFIDINMGLWIYITNPGSDGMLRVKGYDPGTTQIQLKAGWNLVGYPSLAPEAVGNALFGTGADHVEVFDPAEPGFIKEVGPTYIMSPGEGYWVHVNSDVVWTVSDSPVIPDPYSIYGTVYLYDGTSAGDYNPLVSVGGASINVTWWNPNIGWESIVSGTSPTGQFIVDISNYTDEGLVYISATFDAPYNSNGYNYTYIDVMMGSSFQNVVCGVPYEVRITNPLNQSMTMAGLPFMAIYEILDVDGQLAQGYFSHSDGPMRWLSDDVLFVPPADTFFDGTASLTPGTAMDLLTLYSGGGQYHWVNISEGGGADTNDCLTPWGEFYLDPYNMVPGWMCDCSDVYLLVQ